MTQVSLPQNLDPKALAMFDKLVAQDRLKYQATYGEIIEVNGFKVSGQCYQIPIAFAASITPSC